MHDVLFDISRLLGRFLQGRHPTGVDRVSLEYVKYFSSRATALVRFGGRWIEFDKADSQIIFSELLAPSAHFESVVRWCVARSYLFRWGSGDKRRLLLNTDHSGLNELGYARQVKRRGLQPVFFLHDIIPITHPEYSRPGESERHQRRLMTMTTAGCGLIVNSAATQAAFEGYARQSGLTIPPCAIARLAPAPLPPPAAMRPTEEPYFVVLGTIEPRKNHLLLLKLWRQMFDELGEAAPRLVVIGQRGWECEQVVDMLERCKALNGCVMEISRCSDAELSTWLCHAQALLFPSFVEGFGMPLVEALAMGLPVIASDLSVFREIAGDVPDYLDPLDGVGWKQSIRAYTELEHPLRLAQLERMRTFIAPTWDAHFIEVECLLEKVIGQ